MKIPRIPPPGHRYPPDVVDHALQTRALAMLDDKHDAWDSDYPPKGSPEEMTLEEIAEQLNYPLPIPDEWHPPKIPNLDEQLQNADWLRRRK